MAAGLPIAVDVELTNRCNASCNFCPREQTPHQGFMAPATFDQALVRAEEYHRVAVSLFPESHFNLTFCGMGEPLLHPNLPDYVSRVAQTGILPALSSNGSLLTEDKATALLDAGLKSIYLNVGEHDDDYEATYHLPWQRTVDNVVRFNELAGDQCEVIAVLVDHRDDPDHLDEMRAFWAKLGVEHTFTYALSNRGGSLDAERLRFHTYPEVAQAWDTLVEAIGTPLCGVPFHRMFIGYDGAYYLCGSDWEKRAAMSNVFDSSFLDITDAKLAHVASRRPVCETCNVDPTNMLAAALHGRAEGTATDDLVDDVVAFQTMRIAVAQERIEKLGNAIPEGRRPETRRPLIPVSATP
jgi:MoaA/NifB/PqqE/SkfB family radical SAM enzyme